MNQGSFDLMVKEFPPVNYRVKIYEDKDEWLLLNGRELRINNDKWQACLEKGW